MHLDHSYLFTLAKQVDIRTLFTGATLKSHTLFVKNCPQAMMNACGVRDRVLISHGQSHVVQKAETRRLYPEILAE